MKFLELVTKGIGKVWRFVTSIVMVCLISAVVLFCIAVFMPDNVLKAIEIIKGIVGL